MSLVLSVFEQGLIYAIMALGLYITYKILDFPDMTVDGSFPLGAAITAMLITKGWNPFLTLPISFAAGAVAGMLTGLIHVKLRVRDLLSGIIMMTALYTVNLRIAGKANLPIYNMENIFDNKLVNAIIPESLSQFKTVIVAFVITMIVKYILDWYLSTKSGFMLRAVGGNETIVTSLGVDKGWIKILGLALGDGFAALSGCMFAQQQRYFDVTMGTGTVVIGLASVIIGTTVFKKVTFLRVTSSVVIGSLIYKACVAVAIRMGMQSTDLKLITAILFLLILVVGTEKEEGEEYMLELQHIHKFFNPGSVNEICLFDDFNLTVKDGEFVSVVGSNGSGKTSMLNIICGSIDIDHGQILIDGKDYAGKKDFVRSRQIGRVFQDPSKGTCPQMTILENMSIAENKGKPFNLTRGVNKAHIDYYREMLAHLNLGLEDKMHTPVGALSGGQRQAVALLMATMTPIDFLILDEHTAALDPKTAEIIMQLTDQVVREKKVTTIMVTHNLRYAVEYGSRLLMMHEGKVILDKTGEEKKNVDTEEIMKIFNQISVECGN